MKLPASSVPRAEPDAAATASAGAASKKPPVDGFVLALFAVVFLAWLVPSPGATGGFLRPEVTTKAGVALVFFLSGLTLSFGALRAGTMRWKVHLVVQLSTFLLFPLLGIALYAAGSRLDPSLRLGLFYLTALPSTVSSSVALTAAARGNVPAAVFNATLSSLLGVVLTPLWLSGVLGAAGQGLPLGKVILDLMLWLVLPLAVGQLVRPVLGEFATRHKKRLGLVDRGTILLLVYTSFCDSFQRGVFLSQGPTALVLTAAVSLMLLFSVLWATGAASRVLGFSEEDRIAAVFCGSKKTLASGVPMARLIFGAHAGLSMILLPIMIYHSLQLVVCTWLAGRWAKRGTA